MSACYHDVDEVFHAVAGLHCVPTVFVKPFEDGLLDEIHDVGAEDDIALCDTGFDVDSHGGEGLRLRLEFPMAGWAYAHAGSLSLERDRPLAPGFPVTESPCDSSLFAWPLVVSRCDARVEVGVLDDARVAVGGVVAESPAPHGDSFIDGPDEGDGGAEHRLD